MADDAAAQRAWELEMENAIESRGRTRSRSILAESTSERAQEAEQQERSARGSRRRYHDQEDGDEQMYQLDALEREIDIVDGGHDPSWTRSDSGGSAMDMRSRARSFSARKVAEMEEEAARHRDSGGRRRSSSFSSLQQPGAHRYGGHGDDDDDEDGDSNDMEQIVKRAASLSKIYLVGSAPVDVSKLQDDSKIVGVKKVEVVQPTGALSAKALDALSEGLQLSVDNSLMLGLAKESERQLTEEQLEEKKMEEEEDHKLKAEKMSTRKTLTARASMFKAKVFKSKAKALSPSEGAKTGAGDASAASSTGATEKNPSDGAVEIPVAPKKRHKLKLLLLGDSGVGKTSLMRVFSGDVFSESMLATAGVDFKLRHTTIADEEITLQIWDTAGQERFHRITATYYKGANGIVLVYDVSDKKGFDNVGYWMNNIRQYSSPHMPAMLLVGNKIDLPNRVVTFEEGQAAANQYNCRFIETSAKTSENTNGALETIARDAFLMSLNQSSLWRDVTWTDTKWIAARLIFDSNGVRSARERGGGSDRERDDTRKHRLVRDTCSRGRWRWSGGRGVALSNRAARLRGRRVVHRVHRVRAAAHGSGRGSRWRDSRVERVAAVVVTAVQHWRADARDKVRRLAAGSGVSLRVDAGGCRYSDDGKHEDTGELHREMVGLVECLDGVCPWRWVELCLRAQIAE